MFLSFFLKQLKLLKINADLFYDINFYFFFNYLFGFDNVSRFIFNTVNPGAR